MTQYRIGLLAFPGMTQLDLTGPLQVFASLPGAEVHVLWKTLDPIKAQGGLTLVPDTTLADCPDLDVICVPGGAGVIDLMEDQEVLSFLRAQAEQARFVGSICTGSLVLGAAGLLLGRKATTHWAWTDLLVPLGAIPTKGRVVRDEKFFTGGGVTAGIDFALTMVAELAGQETAEAIQLGIEYAPAPPFNAGSPDTARPELVAAVRAGMTKMRAEREERVAKVAAGLR
jgi:cyclohexyl-isocyanide hydratase